MLRTACCLLGASVLAVACSSGTKTPAAVSTTSAPSSSAPSAAAGACHTAAGPAGASGSGDVVVPGDIPDTQAYVTYPSPDGYRVDVPEGWPRSQSSGTVAFSDKFNSIRVNISPVAAAPTVSSAQSTDVAALSGSATCFQAGTVAEVSRKAGNAIRITYKADSAPDPVTGKVVRQDVERYEFWRNGKLAAITLASPVGSDNVDPWKKVTDSFAWTS